MTAVAPYWAYFTANFRALMRYRVAALAGFATQAFWGLLRLSLFAAFYAALPPNERPPLNGHELTAYLWLGQALFVLLPMRPDPEAVELVREGNLAYELTRPLDMYSLWFARSSAQRLAPMLLRLPLVALFAVLVPSADRALSLPPSFAAFAGFIAALAAAWLLSGALTAFMSVLCLWIDGGNGVAQLIAILAFVSSGLLLPLPMLPKSAQTIATWLPFAGLLDTPLRLYSSQIPPARAAFALARTLAWACTLIAAGRFMLRRSLARVEVQGG